LINGFLNVSRLESGKIYIDRKSGGTAGRSGPKANPAKVRPFILACL